MTHGKAMVALASEYVANLKPANNVFGGSSEVKGEAPALTRAPFYAKVKCSSFVTLLINQLFDVAPTLFVALFLSKSPTASRYYDAVERGMIGGTKRVSDIDPGDVLFIKYDELRNGFTGHSAIVAAKPRKTDEPFGDFDVYALDVIDATRTSHGPGDTRWNGGEQRGGVGKGTMRLLVREGVVAGYLWRSTGASEVCLDGQGLGVAFGKIPAEWALRPRA